MLLILWFEKNSVFSTKTLNNVRHWHCKLAFPLFSQRNHGWSSWIEETISRDARRIAKWLVEKSSGCASDSNHSWLLQNFLLAGNWLIFITKMPVLSWLLSLNDIILKFWRLETRNKSFSCWKLENIAKANTFCTSLN